MSQEVDKMLGPIRRSEGGMNFRLQLVCSGAGKPKSLLLSAGQGVRS